MSDSTEFPSIDETVVRRFENDCQSRWPVRIEDYLSPGDGNHPGTLEELVAIELECAWKRWKSNEANADANTPPAGLEQYVDRFPKLKDATVLGRLAKEEMRLRLMHGDDVTPHQYRSRFPELSGLPEAYWHEMDTLAAPSETGDDISPGRFDRYRILDEQGRGGFATVWKAADPKLGRDVALKQLRVELVRHPNLRKRFLLEARIAARLEHPGIVPVHDLADETDARPWYTMKLVRGETLAASIRAFHQDKSAGGFGSVAFRRLLESLLAVSRTMEYAHAQGVLHRDLKPHNIVVGEYGETVILDWGLAKIVGEGDEETAEDFTSATAGDATLAGEVKGTPAYMSPEQAEGRINDVGERSDIYSLGVILYELLAGQLPYPGKTASEVLRQVITAPVPRPSSHRRGVPKPLEAICRKAMAKSPDDRYAKAAEFTAELERFQADEPVQAWREPLWNRVARWMRRHRSWTIAGAAALFIVAGVASVAAVLVNEERKAARESEQSALVAESNERAAREKETAAKLAAIESEKAAKTARQQEREQREAAEWRLVRTYVRNGQQRLNDIDYLAGLLWYVQALEADATRPAEAAVHRRRINAVLRRCLKLHKLVFFDDDLQAVRFSEHNRRVFVVGKNALYVVSADDGKRLSTVKYGQPATMTRLGPRQRLIATTHLLPKKTEVRVFDIETGKPKSRWDLTHKATRSPFVAVSDLTFNADGSLLAVCGTAGVGLKSAHFARVWKTESGEPASPVLSHGNRVAEAAFSTDGKHLITASWDKTAGVWNVETGKREKTLTHQSLATHLAVSPDGKTLATSSRNVTTLWQLPAATKLRELQHPPGIHEGVTRIVFSPDGKYLATVNNSHLVRVWDPATGRPISQYGKHDALITHLEFTQKAPLVLTSSADGTARLWTARGGRLYVIPMRHAGQINRVTAASDRQRFATIGKAGTLRLWGTKSHGGPAWQTLKHAERFISKVAFSPVGHQAITVTRQPDGKGVLRAWNSETGTQIGKGIAFPAPVTHVEHSPDGRRLLAVSTSPLRSAKTHRVEIRDAKTLRPIQEPVIHKASIDRAKFSANGRFVVTASKDGTATVTEPGGRTKHVWKHPRQVNDVDVSADGSTVVTGCADGGVRVWSTATGQLRYPPLMLPSYVRYVILGDNGRKLLAVCGKPGAAASQSLVYGWSTADGKPLFERVPHAGYPRPEFSPDGNTLFVYAKKSSVQIHGASDGRKIGSPMAHQNSILSARFSPDGKTIATCGTDRTARVWNAADGTPVTAAINIGSVIPRISFSANGRYILTNTMGNAVNVHDARTGERVAPTMYLNFFDVATAFSPDMKSILTGGRSARLWNFAPRTDSLAELKSLAELLSGHRIDEVQSMVPLTRDELLSRWRRAKAN